MPKHYTYRMDHDIGFAPNVEYGSCTLCLCKCNTIEVWAKEGSWIFGVGGNNTNKANKLIYAMKVEKIMMYTDFKKQYPRKSKYLKEVAPRPSQNVLFSKKFYYFGNKAIDIPMLHKNIIWERCGCKKVADNDVEKFSSYLGGKYRFGKHGQPNNCNSIDSKENGTVLFC